jgi:two-component system, NarL family, nitrate/nitrite response regulator NarL
VSVRSVREPRIRVYVAEDHPIYLEGLVRAIKERPEFELVGAASDGRLALEQIRDLSPDLAVLDLRLPGLHGREVLHAIVRDALPTAVIVLSAISSSEAIFDTVKGGARAYLTKDSSRITICDAIAAVARGETVLAPHAQAALAGELRTREDRGRPLLSNREREVLRFVSEGLSGPEIGKRLHLSAATVKTHMQNAYDKLGVSERAAAVAEAMRRGLLE